MSFHLLKSSILRRAFALPKPIVKISVPLRHSIATAWSNSFKYRYLLALFPALLVNSMLGNSSECSEDATSIDARMEKVRPSPSNWVRLDDALLLENKTLQELVKNNALHDTLMGDGMIQEHEIYKSTDADNSEIYCIFHFGDRINGHPGVVHGGILALAFDNCFGWVAFAAKAKPGVTANLNINYRCGCLF
jgi:hypothetical protein